MAGNALAPAGLEFSKGLESRGYVYTDRPVYRPGDAVNIRGILRTEELRLSEFGSFATQFRVAEAGPVGEYKLIARRVAGRPSPARSRCRPTRCRRRCSRLTWPAGPAL